MAKRTDVSGGQTATPILDPERELPPHKSLAEEAKDLAQEAKQEAKEVAGKARNQVQQLVGQQKDQVADRLHSLAEALREAGHKLNEGQQAGDFGQYADRAAQQVERVSTYLHENDLRGFVRDTEKFARRRPEVFLGGTLVAGLMLARFLKASSPSQGSRSGYDGGAWTGYPQSTGRSSYQEQSSQGQSSARASSTPQQGNDVGGANLGATPSNPPMGA
jgi:hypothetical protein